MNCIVFFFASFHTIYSIDNVQKKEPKPLWNLKYAWAVMEIYYSKTDYTSSKNDDVNYNKLSYLQNVRNLLASKVMIIFLNYVL